MKVHIDSEKMKELMDVGIIFPSDIGKPVCLFCGKILGKSIDDYEEYSIKKCRCKKSKKYSRSVIKILKR